MDAPWALTCSLVQQISFEHRLPAAVVLGFRNTEMNQTDVFGEGLHPRRGGATSGSSRATRQVEMIVISEEINRALSEKGLEEGGLRGDLLRK